MSAPARELAPARPLWPAALAVTAVAAIVSAAAAFAEPGTPATAPVAIALGVLALAALLRPVEPAPGEKLSLAAAVAFFGALVLPMGQALLAVLVASAIARAARRTSLVNAVVNSAVLTGATAVAGLASRGHHLAVAPAPLGITAVAGAGYALSTLAGVGVMIAATRGAAPFLAFLAREWLPTAALVALGALAAIVWRVQPEALVLVLVPLAIVELSARGSSRLHRSAADLARALDAQRVLAADAAHELRNPLAAINGNLAYLEAAALRDDARDALTDARVSVRHLMALVERLILLSRAERTADPDARAEVASVVDRVVAQVRPRDDVRLVASVPESLAVAVPPDLFESAMRDLVTNAAAYTEHGTISVSARADGPRVEVAVADTGIGIAASEIGRVFDRFYRGRAASHVAEGSGLGLAIVRRIAESHGGSVHIESAEGQGTTVFLRLPRA